MKKLAILLLGAVQILNASSRTQVKKDHPIKVSDSNYAYDVGTVTGAPFVVHPKPGATWTVIPFNEYPETDESDTIVIFCGNELERTKGLKGQRVAFVFSRTTPDKFKTAACRTLVEVALVSPQEK